MTKKTTRYIKCILLCLIIWSLSAEILASETIKNMPSRNAYFTGRASYLNEIQKNLSRYGIVYLTGYGGVGKTQLAKEYSYINEQKYDLIWWFDLRGDLVAQYENLLTHLSNNEKFKKLFHINIKDIAPSVVVDFTNSLLLQCNCRWLLIFDNVLSTKDIKLPKTKAAAKQHIIITTREKQNFGKNVLTLEPFTDQESDKFLTKIHPKEGKDNIIKLRMLLKNYPLALAQVSEEILMQKDRVDSYLKKHNNRDMKKILMNTNLTQEYSNTYSEVLNITLQNIEQKDKESANFLYMLSLLKAPLTKELLLELFGKEIEDHVLILSKYGIIRTEVTGQHEIFNIHDIIKEEAIKKLNNKDTAHKKEIVNTLIEHFKNLYANKDLLHLNSLEATNYQIVALYDFVNIALENDIIDEGVINAVIIALRLQNILFNKDANPILYQQLSKKIYHKNLDNISTVKKAQLYASLIFISSYLFESKDTLSKFEKEMIDLLSLIENKRHYSELFFIHTHMCQFYVLLGDFQEAKKYAEKAKKNIDYADSIFVILRYWFANAWLCYELRDVANGMKALDKFIMLSNNNLLTPVGKLYAKDFEILFMLLTEKKGEAKKELTKAISDTTKYYNGYPSSILGDLEYTKILMYFQDGQYKLAKKQCHRALNILAKIFGENITDLTQAHIQIMLGKIYEEEGNNKLALEKYGRAFQYFSEKSYGRVNNLYEYGELLSNLCCLYYKQKNYPESKFYFQKLVANFDLEHELVEKLIKKLPVEYMYNVGSEK